MRRSFAALALVAGSLSLLTGLGCSSEGSSPAGTGAGIGSGGSGNTANMGGSAGVNMTGGASASGGANTTGGNAGSGATSGSNGTGGSAGTGNAGSGSGASGAGGVSGTGGDGGSTGGTPPAVDDGCALLPEGAVTFSVPSGTFEASVTVELTIADAGAEIRYTTDHTPPTPASTLYAGALTFTQTTELRVQAFAQGAALGGPQTAVYVARGMDVAHDLPVMILDSYGVPVPGQDGGGFPGGGTTDREYIDAAMMTFEPVDAPTSFASPPKTATASGFHVRGQSSSSYDKKPYRLELRDANSEDRNCALVGMPSESDWVLHSPYPDKALIRNAFVYSLGPELGLTAPRAKFVELYLNTAGRPLESGDYQGVYLLTETIKNQKDRLNLQQLEPEDTMLPALSGGYIFKFEWRVMDIEQTLTCPTGDFCWQYLEVADPKPWVQEQHDYLAGYLRQLTDALHSATPADPVTGYPAFLDTASFVNQVIMHELTRNLDAYTRSQYLHKERDGKVVTGPLWDYDLIAGVGTRGNSANIEVEGFQLESNAARFEETADWFPLLFAEPTFHAALVTRWKELRLGVLSDAQLTARIDGLAAGLAAGATRNFTKWPILTTERIGFFDTPVVDTWEGQVVAMRDWLIARAAWLDTQWI